MELKWIIPVVAPYKISDDARQHLNRSDLCGIDFYSFTGSKTISSFTNGVVVYVHTPTQDSYDQLGNFIVFKYMVEGEGIPFAVFCRYCHNASYSVQVGDAVFTGSTVGVYGNTGVSNGDHLHADFWIAKEDAGVADYEGFKNTNRWFDRQPWPGAPVLRNVDPTEFLTDKGLDVINSGGM